MRSGYCQEMWSPRSGDIPPEAYNFGRRFPAARFWIAFD